MSATWRVLEGGALSRLADLPDESVQTCVTSPPYYGLRDYGVEGQIGLEATPDEFVATLVAVFREVRRVLRDDGTLWLNLGDSYSHGGNGSRDPERWPKQSRNDHCVEHSKKLKDTKPKDLIGIPWMVAFALRADGWYLRSDIVWSKPNPMPESVVDRPTRSHEFVFLLSKSRRYFYDAEAIREPDAGTDHARSEAKAIDRTQPGAAPHRGLRTLDGRNGMGRNRRTVWEVATQPFAGAHFATFPPKLVEPCVLAGSSPAACGECGSPANRVLGPGRLDASRPQARRALELAREHGLRDAHVEAIRSAGISDAGKALVTTNGTGKNVAEVLKLADEARQVLGGYYREFLLARPTTTGWRSTCDHDDDTGRCVVLDPFAGAGTTGLVALRHGRSFVGVELNPAYAAMARDRIRDDAPLLNCGAEIV